MDGLLSARRNGSARSRGETSGIFAAYASNVMSRLYM